MRIPFYQIDAFTDRPFQGNPAAVMPLESWLTDIEMLAVARENNLSETAFFVKEADGLRIRWFTPEGEIDLCGHATLASAFVLFTELGFPGEVLEFASQSGPLKVTREGDRFILDFPSRPPLPCETPSGLFEALGLPPRPVSKARDHVIVLDSEAAVLAVKPDYNALAEVDVFSVIITAPGSEVDFVSRFFTPAAGIPEDPVTGSAHCTLIPYWSARLNKCKMQARQVSARGGELFCEACGDRVRIGGQAVKVLEGQLIM